MTYESGVEVPNAEEDELESEIISTLTEVNESTQFDQQNNDESRVMNSDVDEVPKKSSDETVHNIRYVLI